MNGHDDYFNNVSWKDQDKEYDLEGNEVPVDEEPKEMLPGNPMIDYEPQDELDRVSNRESYSFFQNNCENN